MKTTGLVHLFANPANFSDIQTGASRISKNHAWLEIRRSCNFFRGRTLMILDGSVSLSRFFQSASECGTHAQFVSSISFRFSFSQRNSFQRNLLGIPKPVDGSFYQ